MDPLNKKKLYTLLCRFRPEELSEIIEVTFGKFNWEDIKSDGYSRRINLFSIRNLASLCVKAFESCNPTKQDVQSALWYLKFYDASLHENIVWNCAILTNETESFPTDIDDFHRRLIRAYRTEARNTEIITKFHDDIIWAMLIEKIITKRGIKHGKPFYAAIDVTLEKRYVFYYPKTGDYSTGADHISLLGKALGYDSFKRITFNGRDVRSMFTMIKRHSKPSNVIVPYNPRRFSVEGNVMDFTQGREREAYALRVLPPGCTRLSEFTIEAKSEWQGPGSHFDSPALITTTLKFVVKGRKGSVDEALRHLIAQNLISIPVPEYIRRLPSLDKNYIKIRPAKEERTENSEAFSAEER